MSVEYKLNGRAYTKMIFHAAKYPHLSVNGILLADKTKKKLIVDAIPLFHQCLYLSPMAEIALIQIEAYAEREQMVIAGYYAAAEHFYDNSVEKAPGSKIAEKILENYKNASFVVLDNKLICLEQVCPALQLYTSSGEGNRWMKTPFALQQTEQTLDAVSALLKRGAMKDIVDFDNHLDNPKNDWTNEFLNRDLEQIMAMY